MGKGILDTLKEDTKDAAYRVAGTQIMHIAKDGVLNVLRKRGVDNKYVDSVANFIDTDVGTALLSTCVGFTFSYVPPFKNDKRAKTLAKEFRVGGMALAGNLLADKAVLDLLPKFTKMLDVLPKVETPKLRIPESTEQPVYEELEEYTSSPSKSTSDIDAWLM